MTRIAQLFLVIALPLCSLGCTNEITDTEARTFTFDCKGGQCTLIEKPSENPGAKSETQGRTHHVQRDGRVLTRCPTSGSDLDCRPLTCEESSPCSALGGAEFVCDSDLCQAPARALTPADRSALCLAGTGDWMSSPEQVQRITLARGCLGDCFLPPTCRKP